LIWQQTATSVVIGTDCIGNYKSNYHTMTTMTVPLSLITRQKQYDISRKDLHVIVKISSRVNNQCRSWDLHQKYNIAMHRQNTDTEKTIILILQSHDRHWLFTLLLIFTITCRSELIINLVWEIDIINRQLHAKIFIFSSVIYCLSPYKSKLIF
jgi:hypothetical protein